MTPPTLPDVVTAPPPPLIEQDPAKVLEQLPQKIRQVQVEIAKVVVGQEHTVEAALFALFSRGHCLLVGVPGLAKTLLVHALARSVEFPFSRIQFTPDLMPLDITGTEILEETLFYAVEQDEGGDDAGRSSQIPQRHRPCARRSERRRFCRAPRPRFTAERRKCTRLHQALDSLGPQSARQPVLDFGGARALPARAGSTWLAQMSPRSRRSFCVTA